MALHHSLRELVEARGAAVVEDSDELRAALDDFLAEDEATLGELNLLVDAVRLGALRRLVDVLDHGAEPAAAVWDAGRALARDRGTDDPTRSCWALAGLGYALGKVDESVVHAHRANAGTVAAPVPPPAPGPDEQPAAAPVVAPAADPPADPVPAPVAQPAEDPAPPTTPVPVGPYGSRPYGGGPLGPVGPVIPEEHSGGGTWLVVALALLVVAAVAIAGFFLFRSGGDDPAAGPEGSPEESSSSEQRSRPPGPATLPAQTIIVPFDDDNRGSRLYSVDIRSDSWQRLTDDGVERLAAISPDRATVTYLADGTPGTLMARDVETGRERPLFPDGPCEHAFRPGFNPDGSRIALICTGPDESPEGIFVVDSAGETEPVLVVPRSDVRGSPTWVSDDRFVFGTWDPEDEDFGPKALWAVDATGTEEPQPLPTPEALQVTHADWSEGRGLLFLTSAPGSEEVGDLYLMDPGLTRYALLADGLFSHPAFSPDGSRIVVTTYPDGLGTPERLAVLPTADPARVRIVGNAPPGEVGIPAWGTR